MEDCKIKLQKRINKIRKSYGESCYDCFSYICPHVESKINKLCDALETALSVISDHARDKCVACKDTLKHIEEFSMAKSDYWDWYAKELRGRIHFEIDFKRLVLVKDKFLLFYKDRNCIDIQLWCEQEGLADKGE